MKAKSNLYFLISYIAYTSCTLGFAMRGAVASSLISTFNFTGTHVGEILGFAFWGVAIGSAGASFLIEMFGFRIMLLFACVLQLLGITIFLLASSLLTSSDANSVFWLLSLGVFLMGLGEGDIFAVIHPLVSIIHADEEAGKTSVMNYLHTNWPLFIAIGSALAALFVYLHIDWHWNIAVLFIVPIIYGILTLATSFPTTYKQELNIPESTMTQQLFKPGYILLLISMIIIAAVELGPQEWISTLMEQKLQVNGLKFLIFASCIQLVFRLFGGVLAKRWSPPALLAIASFFSVIGLFLFSYVDTEFGGLIAALCFGLGVAWYWPTLLAMSTDRYPKGGSIVLGFMNCIGFLSVALVLPYIGRLSTLYGPSHAFRMLAELAIFALIIFALMAFYFYKKGGYKAIKLHSQTTAREI